jgi:hypothetical protein
MRALLIMGRLNFIYITQISDQREDQEIVHRQWRSCGTNQITLTQLAQTIQLK